MGMNGDKGKPLKFRADPFYLYPVKEDMIDRLFVNRKEEINIVTGLLGTSFANTAEICAVIGGIGVGKSSTLYCIMKIAKEMGYKAEFYNGPEDFYSGAKRPATGKRVEIIDDVGKASEKEARRFYATLEKHGGIVFFSDTYARTTENLKLRQFTVSQSISLPKGLSDEKLRFFIEERMKKCLAPRQKFVFPFEDEALQMASTRSAGNLRSFLNYAKNGWRVATGSGRSNVAADDMKAGMIILDRSLLGSCDLIDLKILWHSTRGAINKSFLAHQSGIDTKTLDSRLDGRLAELVTQKRSGKEIVVSSIYRYVKDGDDILEKVIDGLGIHRMDITAGKEDSE